MDCILPGIIDKHVDLWMDLAKRKRILNDFSGRYASVFGRMGSDTRRNRSVDNKTNQTITAFKEGSPAPKRFKA